MIRVRTPRIKHKDQIESTKRKTLGLEQEHESTEIKSLLDWGEWECYDAGVKKVTMSTTTMIVNENVAMLEPKRR
jgi:hypothetical protein